MVQGIVIWGLITLGATVLGGVLAGIKNRDVSFWMGWSFVFPPMAIFLLLLPRRNERPKRRSLDEEDAAEA
jgi:hypothetical protein